MVDPNCDHCNPDLQALSYRLLVTDNFYVVCDAHPLIEGHLLIIPKEHISCVGAFNQDLFTEFLMLYDKFYAFVKKSYSKAASFEHGVIGQTVFHAHVHILPFAGTPEKIIPEGSNKMHVIQNIGNVRDIFQIGGQYLFFSIGESMWTVDTALGVPRFFRDRFAVALGHPERGDWRKMEVTEVLLNEGKADIERLKNMWNAYTSKSL